MASKTSEAEKPLTPEEQIDAAISKMNAKFGDRTVGRLGDKPVECEVIPTGSLALDLALGVGGIPRKRIAVLWGLPGSGKAQPLDARVLTPSGWTTIGEINAYDYVINPAGGAAMVVGVYPQGKRPIYRVTFGDHSTAECDLEHLWEVQIHPQKAQGRQEVLPLSDIISHIERGTNRRLFVPLTTPVEFEPSETLPLHPYVMGCLLGDGCFRNNSISLTTADQEILDEIAPLLPAPVQLKQISNSISYNLTTGRGGKKQGRNPVLNAIRDLGLWKLLSHEKFIPDIYLYASAEDRIALLQGLMDTDGTIGQSSAHCSFSSTSLRLARGVQEIARSLGGVATTNSRHTYYPYGGSRKRGRLSHRVGIHMPAGIVPFRLPRKAERYSPNPSRPPVRRIVSAEYIGEREAACIMLDSPEQLYITDNYLVTHNTTLMQHLVAECQQMGGTAAYIDMEHKLDQTYAQACGMNLKDVIFSQPPSGTAALEIVQSLIDHVDLIVVDSVYDLVTPAELDSDPGDSHYAKLARLMSQELKKIKPQLGFSNCALVFVNQVRTGIGSGGRAYHVNPGGFAVSFAPSIVVKLKRIGELPGKTGIVSKAYVGKNNVAAPFKECEISIVSGAGIDKYADLLEVAVSAGVVKRAGSWYKYKEENLAKSSGKLPAVKVLKEDGELAQTIREEALGRKQQ